MTTSTYKFISLLAIATFSLFANAAPYYEKNILKVCTDPYMLPFSNNEGEGFENKISELIADKLEMKLEYEYFPQRMGFIRNTLKREKSAGTYMCDLVITVPSNFELASATDSYYTTTYLLAYKKGGILDGLEDPEKINEFIEAKGITEMQFGITDRGPQQLWLFYKELMGFMKTYQGMPGDIKVHPGQKLMEDLADDKIDATIVWGPTAAYYANKLADKGEIVLLPIKDNDENAEAKFEYSMSMAVRYGEKEWKDKIQSVITENMAEIQSILKDYGVPLVEK